MKSKKRKGCDMKKKEEVLSENRSVFIDGREYYFNLKRIWEILFSTGDKTEKEKEIVNTYDQGEGDEDLKLSSKIVRELTSPTATQYETIKYDLLKTFIIQLITFSDKTKIENVDIEIPIVNIDFLPLGTRMVFNTLIEEQILIKKEYKND